MEKLFLSQSSSWWHGQLQVERKKDYTKFMPGIKMNQWRGHLATRWLIESPHHLEFQPGQQVNQFTLPSTTGQVDLTRTHFPHTRKTCKWADGWATRLSPGQFMWPATTGHWPTVSLVAANAILSFTVAFHACQIHLQVAQLQVGKTVHMMAVIKLFSWKSNTTQGRRQKLRARSQMRQLHSQVKVTYKISGPGF